MSRPKSPDQQFESSWNKAAAWAQSQGIPSSDYLPVYQLDATRLQSGYSAMSAAERNRAILAANNPNNVSPLPTDNPSPTSVLGNARNDLGSIVTGLEPQHLVANLFDTVFNTAKDVIDPKRLVGKNLDATVANVLQDTLLSFVPGAYDLGAFTRAGGGTAGLDALAQHPLVSLLDILPAGSSKLLNGALADTALGARLAEAGGMSKDAFHEMSMQQILGNVLKNHVTSKSPLGFSPSGASGGIHALTASERLQTWAGKTKLGTSKPIQDLLGEYMLNNQLYTGIKQNLEAPALHAFDALGPEEKVLYQELFRAQSHGDDMQRLLNDPSIPLAVQDAARKMIDGPLRFETEQAILGATHDVMPIRRPDGHVGLYSGTGHEVVKSAKSNLADAHAAFVASLDATDRVRQVVEAMDTHLPVLTDGLTEANQAARAAIPRDDSLLENVITQSEGAPGEMVRQTFGKKADQANAMFGEGGLVDSVLEAARQGDTDAVRSRADILASRLNRWGHQSVDASANPAFMGVRDLAGQLATWGKRRQYLTDEINRRIEGEPQRVTVETKRQQELLRKAQTRDRSELVESQRMDREGQKANRTQAVSKANADHEIRTGELRRIKTLEDTKDTALGDNAARRATKAQTDVIHREVKKKIAERDKQLARDLKAEDAKHAAALTVINRTWDKAAGALSERHSTEKEALRAVHGEAVKNIGGELRQKMRVFTNALQEFNKAVYDHPTDEYRDIRQKLYQDRLLASEHNAEILDETTSRLHDQLGWTQDRVDQLHSDPSRLGEYLAVTVQDIYENPLNFNPDLVDAVKEAREEATSSAIDEINTLISQGYRPMWLPAVGPTDRVSSAIKVTVGKGQPHVDVAHQRANFLVNTRYDVVAGVSKATSQRIRRDATIDFVEHSIVPRTITGAELRDQLDALHYGPLEKFDPNAETLTHAYTKELENLGLTRFDPQAMFGFQFPRWQGQATYLPTNLVHSLEKVMEEERKGDSGLFDKTTKLFRMSILGLSPRYTAHILFGGTFLLGLRSTPYMPSMLVHAAKALREGSLPDQIFRTPTQEGFSRLSQGLNEHATASGKQLGNFATQEKVATLFPEAWKSGKVSPFHWLKAAADVNYKFTRYAVKMQSAVAYLDYAASAERRGYFVDEVTGERRTMTKERAMVEGMAHVEDVFGNLRNMSPAERYLSKNIMPFYGWTRHILNYVMSFPADHPWRAMVLALMGYENSESVPKGLPERLQFLFFLGSPDKQGNVTAFDTRFLNPLRDVANYATLGGWLQALNPAIIAPIAMVFGPQTVYGSQELYPNLTYNQFFGIETSASPANAEFFAQQFVPQLGALGSAISAAGNYRQAAANNPNAFYKSIYESLNIPMLQPQHINVKQIAAHDEIARYQVAKQAATNAFQSGNFKPLAGYASVPNPLNADYEITPSELQALYNQALQTYPGQVPVEALAPPPTPAGF